MDLTPRTADDTSAPEPRSRRWLPIVALGLIVVAGAILVTRFLTSAVDYYCNVDEIGERAGCDEGRTLRVQGTVEAGSVTKADGMTAFTMAFNDAHLPVRYSGEPGGIFDECVPVVVHGSIDDGVLRGTRIEVKHSSEYVAENEDRLDDAVERSGDRECSPQA